MPAGNPDIYQQQAANAAKVELLPPRYLPEDSESPLMKMARIALDYAGPKALGLGIDPAPGLAPAAMVVSRKTLPKLLERMSSLDDQLVENLISREASGEVIDKSEEAMLRYMNFLVAKNPKLASRIQKLKILGPNSQMSGATNFQGTELYMNPSALKGDPIETINTMGHELYHSFVSRKPNTANRFYINPGSGTEGIVNKIKNFLYKYQPEEVAARKAGSSAARSWERFQSLIKQEQGLE